MMEQTRLEEDERLEKNWKRFGPYLSERQWATVREDYSLNGDVWSYFSHDEARSRAYRWGEDGILGITDRECRLCFALSFWNGQDPFLKERLFGLTASQGNHGEDVKEIYYYLDSTPTHSYMKALYKYPQAAFPYEKLVHENAKRGKKDPEYELADTGIFKDDRYFDIFVEYAKNTPEDILIKITVKNRSSAKATLHLLPTLWFRNTWDWSGEKKPHLEQVSPISVKATHETLGTFFLHYEEPEDVLFTDNETNFARLYKGTNPAKYVKDAFHDYVTEDQKAAVNPENQGTKCAPLYIMNLEGHQSREIHLRLSSTSEHPEAPLSPKFDQIMTQRKKEADAFYASKMPETFSEQEREVSRQAYAGLLWNKQFYHYVVEQWLDGDPKQIAPPEERKSGRNHDWKHVYMRDVISMPDKWEYPWFAAWDLAFHMIPFSKIDPHFAKRQLSVFLREWYMHPNGQLPAYEFCFSDVNPPVHAWSAWRVYKMSAKRGFRDRQFLESVFQKLLLNFTWWVNRKDIEGNHIFSGGFLGLDNIGVFDRSRQFPSGTYLQQADGTAWMAFYSLTMLSMALELAEGDPVYEDMASKFFEHFVHIADAINDLGGSGLWDDGEGFYYDKLKLSNETKPIRIRSLVGLIPFIAVEILKKKHLDKLPNFSKRMNWFLHHRRDLEKTISYCQFCNVKGDRMLALPSKERLLKMLRYLLDENEFLSPFGIRSLSKIHAKEPFSLSMNGSLHEVKYVPGVGDSGLFGGNSNWRGPIWFPINYLIIEALERYHYFYGDEFKVECPVGSGQMMTLKEVASEISRRLSTIFLPDETGKCPYLAAEDFPGESNHLFHEYFHGESGEGLGASHQTGWTALIAKLFEQRHRS